MDRLVGDHSIKYFELAVPDWLFAKRALSRSCEREEYVLHEYLNKPRTQGVGRHRLCICTKFCEIRFVFEEAI